MDSTDVALQRLGNWGKWQLFLYVIICLGASWPTCWHMLAIVFLGGIPHHRCALNNNTDVGNYIPIQKDGSPSSCQVLTDPTDNMSAIDCPNGYHYYGEVGSTIVSQWDLVCGREYMVETSQTVLIVGVMIGAMVFTPLSDRFGRKPIFLYCNLAMVAVGAITAFCYNYYLFVALRFFAGALQQGIMLTGFVMACELFPANMRTFAGIALFDFWAVGMCVLALFAYLIRDWTYLQLTLSLPGLLTISYIWILPETIPWLVANNKIEAAENILQKAAVLNGVHMPERCLTPADTEVLNKSEDKTNAQEPVKNQTLWQKFMSKSRNHHQAGQAAKYTLIDVLSSRTLCIYALIMCLLWLVNTLVYFGLSLSTAALAGDPYLNFFFSGLIEIPAYTVCIFVLQRFGRRWPLLIFHVVAGVALCITMFVPEKLYKDTAAEMNLLPLLITLNMVGKFGISGSFAIVFLYAPEIFPTTLRAQAMGISSVGGRIGNVLAPFSSLVARNLPWLPGILFGSLSIFVGLLALYLPETLGRPLPQTVEDIENWKRTPTKTTTPQTLEMSLTENTSET